MWWNAPLTLRDITEATRMMVTMGGSPFCSHGCSLAVMSCPSYLHTSSDSSSPATSSSSTVQKIKFSIKDFFSKCDQTRSFLRVWSHLLKKSLMENFIFCAVLPLETRSGYTWTHLLVSNFLSLNPYPCKSSQQARFTDHHKQHCSFLDPDLNCKTIQFSP